MRRTDGVLVFLMTVGVLLFGVMWACGPVPRPPVPAPIPPTPIPTPQPAVVRAAHPLVGPLRIVNHLFVDDTGPRRIFFASAFDMLRLLHDDPARFGAELDSVAAAGYQGTRTFWAVGGYQGFWGGHEVAPVSYTQDDGTKVSAWPNYDDLFRQMLEAYKARGLRLMLTAGDLEYLMPDPATELAENQHVAQIVAQEGGASVVALWEVRNEWWVNSPRASTADSFAQMRRIAAAVKAILPDVLVVTSDVDSAQNPAEFDKIQQGSDLVSIHGLRTPPDRAIDYAMHAAFWGEGSDQVHPFAVWQTEPAGPGAYQAQDDPAYLMALHAMIQITGQADVFHSEAGVTQTAPLASVWGFKEVPAMLEALLPENVGAWPHWGEAHAGAIRWWWNDTTAATVTVEGWDWTPAVPVSSCSVVIGNQRTDRVTNLAAVLTPGYKAAVVVCQRP